MSHLDTHILSLKALTSLPHLVKSLSSLALGTFKNFIISFQHSGKSSIVKLLQRFHSPSEGRISIDGQDLSLIDSLTKHMSIVTTNVKYFNMTITHTVCYGTANATMDKVIRACKIVGIHSMIEKLQVLKFEMR